MWRQILELGEDIMNISYNHPEGINLIGYSQGGLIARGILEAFPDHNVKTFISLSAPQGGQYGTQFLHLFFKNMTKNTAYRLFYSKLGQHTSVGNYWRDPHHEKLYLKYSNFLPFVNNDETCPDTMYFKLGITNLKKLVLIGGPSDGVISPWQSSHFGYYDDDENVLELKDQISFQNDVLGLKTLNDSNRLEIISVDGVTHFDWHCNDSVIDNYIIPYLD
ncbi:palmitoyl-protein thioesterase 2 isoform X2 [Lycorma delicatula]